MLDLKGKKAFVTGGSRGIGKAIVEELVQVGVETLFSYCSQEELAQELEKEWREKGAKIQAIQMDQTKKADIVEVAKWVDKHFGELHVLVNNAGINKPTDFDQIEEEDWDLIMETNLKGPFLVSQQLFPALKKAQGASIIFIGSVSGQYGGPRTAHYACSKAGLMSLAEVVARFGAPHKIRSNTLAAGLIASPMAEAGLQSPAVKKQTEAILLKRFGLAQEVAKSVLFLASENSSYTTGQTLNVNGGLYF